MASKRIDTASTLIKASPSKIYDAFTKPDAIETWLPPEGMTGHMLTFDFRVGGMYRMRLSYRGQEHMPGKTSKDSDEVEVRFLKLIRDKRIEQSVSFNTESTEFLGEMSITWVFENSEQGTNVTVRCEGVPEGIRPEDHEKGLKSTLENLARFAEANQ